MTPSLTIIDEFLVNEKAEEIRRKALEAGFRDLQFMGGTYQGTGIEYQPPELPEAISQFFGREIRVHVSAFRLGHKNTTLHVNIHSDNVIARWAGVYYLNPPEQCQGGTAFYRLKHVNWDTMPTQDILDASGHDLNWLRDKWTDKDAWDLISMAGMKWNRFIFYPTEYFHSRYPLEGWGSDPQESRLVWVVFFDVL